jgi:hypothetical protein
MIQPQPLPMSATMPFRLLLDEAMRWTRRYFKTIYPPIAIPVALITTLIGGAQAQWMHSNLMQQPDPAEALRVLGLFFIIALPLLFIAGLAHAALQVATVDAAAGRAPDMGRAWRFVIRPGVIGTLILNGLAIIASVMCCIGPVLYVAPLLAFVIPAMVEENVLGSAALSRSAQLTRYDPQRNWLSSPLVKILAVFVLTVILEYAVSLLIALPITGAQMVSMFRRAAAGGDIRSLTGGGWLWAQVAVQLISSLLNTAVTLYTSFVISLLFFDVRRRREGADLRQAIDAVAPPPLPPPPPMVR